ncbi:hypothetical protein [Nocardia sp. NRRL S-836]|uniref:DUF6923 family protein n=1 Tax=Nocardia sp. NRRL S-836 TaxID=1519492 RepID=UPI0006AFC806|nr:hypothetical protein [Nocardia sp. NRRL S-836]KOV79109.1 hypothetical protein ADL03_38200 [Nocardia sp. NRRL S-836]
MSALGYSPALGRLVGLTSKGHRHWVHRTHVVLIDTKGVVDDLGPVVAPWFRTDDVSGGTVVGTTFYVRDNTRLHAIDINPASGSYLQIVRSVSLDWPALALDDFTAGPGGKLVGVSAAGHGPGEVVSFDPMSGRVVGRTDVPGLPGKSTYGAVAADASGTIYVVNNRYEGRSRVFRIAGGTAVELSTGPAFGMIDGAGCLPTPMPPHVDPPAPKPEVPLPPAPVPVVPPRVSTPAPVPVAPVVPVEPPVPAPPTSAAPQQPVPVRAARREPQPRKDFPVEQATTPLTKPRKWAMVTIVLVMLGAGAAAARARA